MGEIEESLHHAFNDCMKCAGKLSQIMDHWKNSKCLDSPEIHLVHECYPCNCVFTDIVMHYRQEVCKHKWKYFEKAVKRVKQKGCRECMLVIPVRKKKK